MQCKVSSVLCAYVVHFGAIGRRQNICLLLIAKLVSLASCIWIIYFSFAKNDNIWGYPMGVINERTKWNKQNPVGSQPYLRSSRVISIIYLHMKIPKRRLSLGSSKSLYCKEPYLSWWWIKKWPLTVKVGNCYIAG